MPFKSEAQRRFMYSQHPEMAKRWQEHTPKGTKLPEKVNDTKKKPMKKKASVLAVIVKQAEGEQTQPPGIRPSGALGDSSCQACRHFDGQGMCQKFSYPVAPDLVCDAFEQIDVGTDKIVEPEKPQGITSNGPEEMGVPGGEPVELPDQPMDPMKNFKFAFLLECAQRGLSREETLEQIKKAQAELEKRSNILNIVRPLADYAAVGAVGIPALLGAAAGYGARKMVGPDTDDAIDRRFAQQRKRELADEYERLATEAEYKQQLRRAAGKSGLIRLG